jgi:hypothetical protein
LTKALTITTEQYEAALQKINQLLCADEPPDNGKRISALSGLFDEYEGTTSELI